MGRWIARVTTLALAVGAAALAYPATASETEPIRLPIAIVDSSTRSTVVQPGDHLWKISARHLREVLDRKPADAEISPYWRHVIEENTPNLKSGNPDLIYAGEVIELPAANDWP